jgi:hypothetical protein
MDDPIFLKTGIHTACTLQSAIREERILECSALEARGKARLLVGVHVAVDADGIVSVHVAFFHHAVHTAQDLECALPVPGQRVDRALQLAPIELPVAIGVQIGTGTPDDVIPVRTLIGIHLHHIRHRSALICLFAFLTRGSSIEECY